MFQSSHKCLPIFWIAFLVAPLWAFQIREPLDQIGSEYELAPFETEQNEVKKEDFNFIPNQKSKEETEETLFDVEEKQSTLHTRGISFGNIGSDGSENVIISGSNSFNNIYSTGGNFIEYNSDKFHATVISPRRHQSIVIKGRQVFVNERLVCRNINRLRSTETYQKRRDGSMWYTNLSVGQPMTNAEIQKFEKKKLKLEAEREAADKEREEALAAAEKEREKAAAERERALEKAEKMREAALEEAERAREEAAEQRERALEEAERAREEAAEQRERALEEAEKAREEAAEQRERALEEAERKREETLEAAEKARNKAFEKAEKERQKTSKAADSIWSDSWSPWSWSGNSFNYF